LDSFRLGQEAIIRSVMERRDVLAVMPTGGGKSLCYQLPAVMQPGVTLVISPLIALMNDQVTSMKALGIPAGCIHSAMSLEEKRRVFTDLRQNLSFLLYLSPERIQKPGFAPWLAEQQVNLIAIDEAHCVSQWGHDFRPEYSQLSLIRKIKPGVPMMGLTATATPLVKQDIIEQLGLNSPDEHVYGFYRPNLYYQVEFCEDESEKDAFVLSALKQTPEGRVIVYCGTRKKTESCAQMLAHSGESVAFYHAGMLATERQQMEKDYKSGKVRVLTATNAFGMGIDHPDVRLVVHTQIPGNIESYYQEIGRAGRDGRPATCLLVHSKKDKGLQAFFIEQSEASRKIKALRWSALNAMIQYAEGSECRHADILTYFKDKKRIVRCGHCDSCDPKSTRRVLLEVAPLSSKFKLRKNNKKSTLDQEASMTPEQKKLADELRAWRKEYAKRQDLPAFMIFGDKTLRELVFQQPKVLSDLSNIYGLGDKKIEAFGEVILERLNL
jgi:ATP-dependent DNA helicase RecQ